MRVPAPCLMTDCIVFYIRLLKMSVALLERSACQTLFSSVYLRCFSPQALLRGFTAKTEPIQKSGMLQCGNKDE